MENKLAHNLDSARTGDVRIQDAAPFSNWLLKNSVKKGLQDAGFKMPTVIQASAIPVGKTGMDLLIQSKAGTGKTLIFCTILLENCIDLPGLTSIIVAPTREIALQIENVLQRICACKKFEIVCAIGATDLTITRQKLQTANAVVGTPGRLVHLIESDMMRTSDIKLVVLDEADQLFGSSHRKNLEAILNATPVERQILACSATFCNDLDLELAKVMRNPLLISTKDKIAILIGIKQFVYKLPEKKGSLLEIEAKVEAILNIFRRIPFKLCMIFSCSQSRAETYASYLKKSDWQCELISGALPQWKRNNIFKKFNNYETRILVSTDLMARGIDSENVNLVINLEPPRDMVTYLHRIGRAGRFGSFGIAINVLCTQKDNSQFEQIIKEIGTDFKIHEFPSASATGEVDNFWEPSTFKEAITEETVILRAKDNDQDDNNKENNNINGNNNQTNNSQVEKEEATATKNANLVKNIQILCSAEDSQLSINTNTFCVDSKDSAVNVLNSPLPENKENLLLCQPEDTPTSNRSSMQLSANTIDDASSIAADSQFSLQQELLAPCPSLATEHKIKYTINELRVMEELTKKKLQPDFDVFVDYNTNVLTDTDEDEKQDFNNALPKEQPSQPEILETNTNNNSDVFLDYLQQHENEANEASGNYMPESNENTTVGEDFTNEKQDTSMQVCVDSTMPTNEVKAFENVDSEKSADGASKSSVSDENLTDSQTYLDQTNSDTTTNGGCNADSEPSSDAAVNAKTENQQNLSSAYFFNGHTPKKTHTDDGAARPVLQLEKIKVSSKYAAATQDNDYNSEDNKDTETEESEYENGEEKEGETMNANKTKELWMNEYWRQVNFIQSYSKFMLDYSKNFRME